MCPSHLKDMPPACFIVEAVWLNVLLLKIVFSLWQPLQINRPNSNVGRSRRAVAGASIGTIPSELRSSYVNVSVTNMIAFVINRCDYLKT